jgi:hypothetical protein
MNLDIVREIISHRSRTSVKPREFFVSWNSVPVLAYAAFSQTLLSIKRDLGIVLPGLKPENPGARWPKSTLGALHEGQELSRDDAYTLRDICDQFNTEIAPDDVLEISALRAVIFHCRSLERRVAVADLPLGSEIASEADDRPPESHLSDVDATMAQFAKDNLEGYLKHLPSQGRNCTYYRESHIEATLVADLGERQFGYIDRFIDAVDAELAGKYCWFTSASRHLTVRGLV